MEPIDYLLALRRRWLVVVFATLLGLLVGLLSSLLVVDTPSARVFTAKRVLATEKPSAGIDEPSLGRLSLLLTTDPIPKRVADKLEYTGDPRNLVSRIQVVLHPGSGTMDITATAKTSARATELADAFADELIAYTDERANDDKQQRIERTQAHVDALQQQIDDLSAQLATGAPATEPADPQAQGGDTTRRLLQAKLSSTVSEYGATYELLTQLQTSPPAKSGLVPLVSAPPQSQRATSVVPVGRLPRMAIGILVGFLAGVIIALLLDRMRPRLYSRTTVERAVNLPVLVEIPALPPESDPRSELAVVAEPESQAAEAYRMLRTTLLLMVRQALPASTVDHDGESNEIVHSDPQVVLVTASRALEGTTVTAANLAVTFAESGSSVLLVGHDLRHPRVHEIFGTTIAPGLTDYLSLGLRLEEAVKPTRVAGLSLLAAGTPTTRIERSSKATAQLMADARRLADVVVIEAPPLLESDEASRLTPFSDAVLLVARAGLTSPGDALKSAEILDRLGAPTVGVVLVAEERRPPRRLRKKSTTSRGHGVSSGVAAAEPYPAPATDPVAQTSPSATGAGVWGPPTGG